MTLRAVPMTRDKAMTFIAKHHRHHGRPPGYLFCIGAEEGGQLVGVAVVGRPVARMLQDGKTAEVIRMCTDGTKNACSFLYGAAWRAAREMGYQRLVTYTLPSEGGTSMRATGWEPVDTSAGGGSWSRESRPREDKHPLEAKVRWEVRRATPPSSEDSNG
jgi:hypothetical protein